MDDEQLIVCVSKHPVLYDTFNSKYMDTKYKTEIWKQIGEEVRQPAISCKTRWQNIRDQFRKSWAKKTNQSSGKIRKYKYEDILFFLTPYFVERDASHLELDCDILLDDSSEGLDLEDIKPEIGGKKRKLGQEPSSTSPTKYSSVKDENQSEADAHPIDAFLSGLSATIKSFPPYYQHLAKGKLFAVVQDMELQQLRDTNQQGASRTSTPSTASSP